MKSERFPSYENMAEGERKKLAIEAGHDVVFMLERPGMFMSKEPVNENPTVEEVIQATRKIISGEVTAMQMWQAHETHDASKGIESKPEELGNPERNVNLANQIAMKHETLMSYLVTVPDKNVAFKKILKQWEERK